MNLVEKRAQELGICEDFVNGLVGSLGSKIINGVVWGGRGSKFWCLPNCHPPFHEISLVIYSSAPLILAVHLSIVQVTT